jgi:hypothetical protein
MNSFNATWSSKDTPNFLKQEMTALAVADVSNFAAWWDSFT